MSPRFFLDGLENDIVVVLSLARMPMVLNTSLRVTKDANSSPGTFTYLS